MIDDLIKLIISATFKVHNTLGFGFLESVYENSLIIELRKLGLNVKPQLRIQVQYEGHVVGDFIADLLVEDCLILELKAVNQLSVMHEVQLVNYLKATGIDYGLLINFGSERAEIRKKFRQYTPKRRGF